MTIKLCLRPPAYYQGTVNQYLEGLRCLRIVSHQLTDMRGKLCKSAC